MTDHGEQGRVVLWKPRNTSEPWRSVTEPDQIAALQCKPEVYEVREARFISESDQEAERGLRLPDRIRKVAEDWRYSNEFLGNLVRAALASTPEVHNETGAAGRNLNILDREVGE